MCAAALLNYLRVDKSHNCNVQEDQRCCGFADSLQAQERFAQVTFYEFVANEQDMYEAMDPAHYQYVVVLRNSRDRYLSHWKHMCRENQNQTLPEFDTWWKSQPDNWSFRKICGTRCQQVPKFHIARELFEYTFARLRSFDHVLLLEHWDVMYPEFSRALKWKTPITQLNIAERITNVTYPDIGRSWDPFMSILDDALYEWREAQFLGKVKEGEGFAFAKETQQMLDQYFTIGHQRDCGTPCCAESCSTYR